MTELYFAYSSYGELAFSEWNWAERPLNVLVALPFVRRWDELVSRHPGVAPRSLMLDSGAFSAWQSGHTIDMAELLVVGREPRWAEAVALDVIGDAAGSRVNADAMLAAGSRAMPVFHYGDPWELLDHYTSSWPKVGLSCRFGEGDRESLRFYDRCFARCWPKRYHSFGWIQRTVLLRFPFHSADSSSWVSVPGAYCDLMARGRWVKKLGRGCDTPTLRRYMAVHIDEVLRLQDEVRARWRRELAGVP